MAPLDTGMVMNMRLVEPLGDRVGPLPDDFGAIGEYLRALREHRGSSLLELSETTRIRRVYLQGIEEGDRSVLPARPFAIGYVRSYAEALGVDGDAAAARFKKEWPDLDEPFHDPVGVAHQKRKRSPLIFALVALLVTGVVAWNVVQRVLTHEDRDSAALPAADPAPVQNNTTLAIGAATPAPTSQNLPTPYQTPGLGSPAPEMRSGVPVMQAAAGVAGPDASAPSTFTSKSAIFGAPAGPNALVVLQAKKPASLVVRGAGGAVYFARQLAEGEAYRVPTGENLTAEAVDPSAFVIYVAGQNKGLLVSQQTALEPLAVRPAPPVQVANAAHDLTGALSTGSAVAVAPARSLHHAAPPKPAPAQSPSSPGAGETQTHDEPPAGDIALYPQHPN